MFLVHRKDATRDGSTPSLLYGYGGFGVNLLPRFSAHLYPWLEAGGGYAVANLRGGGEYGEDWHRAGSLGNKQNVFDDFIAAAEYLVKEGWTKPERLAIEGGSNGGLLVGAALTQRPDLFRAVICAGAAPRHGALPPVRQRPDVGVGVRLGRQPGRTSAGSTPTRPTTA